MSDEVTISRCHDVISPHPRVYKYKQEPNQNKLTCHCQIFMTETKSENKTIFFSSS